MNPNHQATRHILIRPDVFSALFREGLHLYNVMGVPLDALVVKVERITEHENYCPKIDEVKTEDRFYMTVQATWPKEAPDPFPLMIGAVIANMALPGVDCSQARVVEQEVDLNNAKPS